MTDINAGVFATAVVVNWNAGDLLMRCIRGLLAQTGGGMDVVVVDNASTDNSLNGVAGVTDRVRVVQTGANLGFGCGANRGVSQSKTPYVLVLNPDVYLADGAIERMVDYLEENPDVGIVGPRLCDAKGRVQSTCGSAPRMVEEICRKFLLHLVFPLFKFRSRRPGQPAAVGWVTGACFLARRKAFQVAGGFDEAFFMYYEDVDLCLRLNAAGWGVHYLPEAHGLHLGGGSSKQALTRMLLVSESSYSRLVRKHLGAPAARLLSRLLPLEMALRTLIWSGLFLVSRAHRCEARARLRAYRVLMSRGAHPDAVA